MGTYTKIANDLLGALGGRANIQSLTHCVTRLRIVLVDESLVEQAVINDFEIVKGSQFQSGQFQVIIGPAVKDLYAAIMLEEAQASHTTTQAPQQTKRWYQRLITTFAEIIIPVLPVIIAGGVIVGLQAMLTEVPFINGATLTTIVPPLQAVTEIFTILYQAIFAFLPVLVAFVATKRFGGSPILGIVLGLSLVLPEFLPAGEASFWQTQPLAYSGQVLPAIAGGFVIATLEKFLTKHTPALLRVLLVPVLSLVLTTVVMLFLIGPLTQGIGNVITQVFTLIFTGPWRFIAGALFGFAYAPLTLTGFHHLFLFVDLQLIAEGGTMIWPMIALSNIAQGSAAFATYFLYRQNKKQKQAATEATQAALIGGVTEPAMFGVNLPLRSAFYAALIGSGIASGYSALLGIQANAIGIGGLPAIVSLPPGLWSHYLLVILLAVLVPFSLTIIIEKSKYTLGRRKNANIQK